jgi:hypothetical protein
MNHSFNSVELAFVILLIPVTDESSALQREKIIYFTSLLICAASMISGRVAILRIQFPLPDPLARKGEGKLLKIIAFARPA